MATTINAIEIITEAANADRLEDGCFLLREWASESPSWAYTVALEWIANSQAIADLVGTSCGHIYALASEIITNHPAR